MTVKWVLFAHIDTHMQMCIINMQINRQNDYEMNVVCTHWYTHEDMHHQHSEKLRNWPLNECCLHTLIHNCKYASSTCGNIQKWLRNECCLHTLIHKCRYASSTIDMHWCGKCLLIVIHDNIHAQLCVHAHKDWT